MDEVVGRVALAVRGGEDEGHEHLDGLFCDGNSDEAPCFSPACSHFSHFVISERRLFARTHASVPAYIFTPWPLFVAGFGEFILDLSAPKVATILIRTWLTRWLTWGAGRRIISILIAFLL